MVFVFNTRGERITKLAGHRDHVNQVAWSRDGMLASCSNDGSVRIWDPHTGNCIINERNSEPVMSISWSPDGKLVSCSRDSCLNIWNNDVLIYSRLFSGPDEIRDAAFGGGGMAVAKREGIEIWDREYRCEERIPGYAAHIVRWSQDGRLAFACDDTIHLRANKQIVDLGTHERLVRSLAWTRDGILASGGKDGMVSIWDPASRRKLRMLAHDFSIMCVDIDRDAARVVACCGGQITMCASKAFRLLTALRCIRTRLRILCRQRKAVELGECTEDRAAYWVRKVCDSRVSELILDALAHWIW